MQIIKTKSAGFTLMELSVAIAIFLILAGMIIVNLQYGNQKNRLKDSATELVQNIRLMQNYASSGKVIKICKGGNEAGQQCKGDSDCADGNGTCGLVPSGGFGIKFLQEIGCVNKYTLYYDLDGCKHYIASSDLVEKEVTLPDSICIDKLEVTNAEQPPASVDLVFQPPLATAYINVRCENCYVLPCGDCSSGTCESGGRLASDGDELKITVKHDKINQSKIITVNRLSGKVSIE